MRPLNLLESAAHLGRAHHVELTLFAALGRRGVGAEPPSLVRFLSGASHAHAWRARLIEERLPVSVGLPMTSVLSRSPGPKVDAALALLEGGDDGALLDALVGALYPVMLAAYDERLAVASPASDPPVVRMLWRVRDDLARVGEEGRLLAPGDGALAGKLKVALEASDGVFGPLN